LSRKKWAYFGTFFLAFQTASRGKKSKKIALEPRLPAQISRAFGATRRLIGADLAEFLDQSKPRSPGRRESSFAAFLYVKLRITNRQFSG
jgi:hypothetical protein